MIPYYGNNCHIDLIDFETEGLLVLQKRKYLKNETFYVQIKKNNFLKTNSYLLAENRFLAALWARYLF